jgi:heme o synthase
MAAGAAHVINNIIDRDIDGKMPRTANRPLVAGRIPVRNAVFYAAALALGSMLILSFGANTTAALMALSGLLFYVIVYTLVLKRRTWQNIVIGGAAGAFPPLVGWAAVTGDVVSTQSQLGWILFGIIFLWTPVHFWALAILIKDDYAIAKVPMLPVVRGDRATAVQIGAYAIVTAAATLVPHFMGLTGVTYLASAVVLNGWQLWMSYQLWREPVRSKASSLFHFSMLYLALLFLMMAIDRAIIL